MTQNNQHPLVVVGSVDVRLNAFTFADGKLTPLATEPFSLTEEEFQNYDLESSVALIQDQFDKHYEAE